VSIRSRIDELGPSKAFISRELSWLGFARRVLHLLGRPDLPLLERVKFAGIVGMLHDEFFMKRISGLKREIATGVTKPSIDGRTPIQEFAACRLELLAQVKAFGRVWREDLLPALSEAGLPILGHKDLTDKERKGLRDYFARNIQPILTPLAVDPEHPFPFISSLGLNLAVSISQGRHERFVRIKVPGNRPRWVPLLARTAVVPLEQVIAANLDLLYPSSPPDAVHIFRVTRGADGDVDQGDELFDDGASLEPGSIVHQVSSELKARRFAGVVRVQVDSAMPKKLVKWLCKQLQIGPTDVYSTDMPLGMSDMQRFDGHGRDDLSQVPHRPVEHPRLARLPPDNPSAIFDEIARGDILVHHPYQSFDSSVLRFLHSAATDPAVLAIKLTIYRTSSGSELFQALAEAARHGKQVAVTVEITARGDEAPNIASGSFLEKEGVHVSYGVQRFKTHVKLALVVREEAGGVRRYAHCGTGNYHSGTAKIYEDLGLLTCDASICDDVATVFNSLTGVMPYPDSTKLLVAPVSMRRRFNELIRRESGHALAGRPSGIDAKMNQLQDPEIIRELYEASQAGVPIRLNIRGLCCLRPGVKGLSESIRVFSVVGRFLEHSRVFRFMNGGQPEHFIGSADWMKRNLNGRVETVVPVEDAKSKAQLDEILATYHSDNCSVWDCGPDGVYALRSPADGQRRFEAQVEFIKRARARARMPRLGARGSKRRQSA
jgi:polyphosphate kinase